MRTGKLKRQETIVPIKSTKRTQRPDHIGKDGKILEIKSKPHRRDFLGKIAAAVAGPALLSACQSTGQKERIKNDEREDVKNFFKTFPKSLPGEPKIVKTWVAGAKKCLVHIKQRHHNGKTKDPKSFLDPNLLKVQSEIKQILEYLINDPNIQLKEVYQEGIKQDNPKAYIESYRASPEDYKMNKSLITNFEKILKENPNDLVAKKLLNELKAARLQLGLDHDAALRLAVDSKISLKRAELSFQDLPFMRQLRERRFLSQEERERLSNRLKEKTPGQEGINSLQMRLVTEERENALLEIISKDKGYKHVTVFGSGHDWSNNIKEWNKKYPKNKICLIEISPKSLKWSNDE